MNGFQVVALIVLGPACIWMLYAAARHGSARQFVLGLALAVTLLFVLRPDLATRVANLLGIGRGADLVSYVSALGVLACFFLIVGVERRVRIQITELSRSIALLQLPRDLTNERPAPGPSQASEHPR